MQEQSSYRPRIGFLLMAAGQSSRLGQPKQLVAKNGITLLQRQVDLLSTFDCDCYCVLGSQADDIKAKVNFNSVNVLVNPAWTLGLGASIAHGISAMTTDIDAVIIVLSDQWRLSQSDLQTMIDAYQQGHDNLVVATTSLGHISPPVLLSKKYFAELKMLTSEQGAKPILLANQQSLRKVMIENARFDLDTPDDLKTYLQYKPA